MQQKKLCAIIAIVILVGTAAIILALNLPFSSTISESTFATSDINTTCSINSDTCSISTYAQQPFGDVLIMRHAIAPGGGDPSGFILENCSTQRLLDDEGKTQASLIGKKLAESTLTIQRIIYSSQWCRCLNTAELIAAELTKSNVDSESTVQEEWGLNSFYQPERGGFTEEKCMQQLDTALLNKLKHISLEDRKNNGYGQILMVTHQVTVNAVTKLQVASGEIVAYDSKTGQAKKLEL